MSEITVAANNLVRRAHREGYAAAATDLQTMLLAGDDMDAVYRWLAVALDPAKPVSPLCESVALRQ